VSGNYTWMDTALATDNYYRIVSVGSDGQLQYSEIVETKSNSNHSDINISNRVKDNLISLQFNNAPAGIYNIRMMNTAGQTIQSNRVYHNNSNESKMISIKNNIAKGGYYLEVVKPDLTTNTYKLVVE